MNVVSAADDLDIQLTGVGDIETSGQAPVQDVLITGVGDYRGRELQTETASVTISGVGSSTVQVSESLTVVISGQGSVEYLGDPTMQVTITGSGTVSQIQ